MNFTTLQKCCVSLQKVLHNYGEELHNSHPSVFSIFFNAKTLDYRFDNQAFVGFMCSPFILSIILHFFDAKLFQFVCQGLPK
jgi:hypothetical protein